jgi:hypothetical protein
VGHGLTTRPTTSNAAAPLTRIMASAPRPLAVAMAAMTSSLPGSALVMPSLMGE